MNIKDRLSLAAKALITPSSLIHEDFGMPFMTVLSSFSFGKKNLKKVVDDGYINNTYVYSIINRIAETGTHLPIKVMRQKGDVIEELEDGEFYDFVHKPNENETWRDWFYKSLVYQLAAGNNIQYGVKPIFGGVFKERYILAPQYVEIKHKNTITGPVATKYIYNYSGKEHEFEVDEILHVKKIQPDPGSPTPIMGLSPLQAAWRTLQASNETITADASLIKNRGAFGMLSAKGQRPVTPEEAKTLDAAIKKKIGGGNKFGSFPITNGGYDFIRFAMSPTDLQILENGVMKLRDLCSVYGVSARMFNDIAGGTYNNSKEDNKKFYTQGVLPVAELEIEKFNSFYTKGWNERDNSIYWIEIDKSKIEALQEDQAKEIVKSRTKATIIQDILKGIGVEWDEESAVVQLMMILPEIDEEKARQLISVKPKITNDAGTN